MRLTPFISDALRQMAFDGFHGARQLYSSSASSNSGGTTPNVPDNDPARSFSVHAQGPNGRHADLLWHPPSLTVNRALNGLSGSVAGPSRSSSAQLPAQQIPQETPDYESDVSFDGSEHAGRPAPFAPPVRR
jgi:hypothetical protein